MKSLRYFFSLVALVVTPALSIGQTTITMNRHAVDADKFIKTQFARHRVPPFSFRYNGKSSETFIAKWQFSFKELPVGQKGQKQYLAIYTDPETGLAVECTINSYSNYGAVDWVLRFRNTGNRNTPQISDVNTGDVNFIYPQRGLFRLHYAEGSYASRSDFAPHTLDMKPNYLHHMRPFGGRSSRKDFPFFNIESPASAGVLVAIGWSGTWQSDIRCISDNSVLLQAGIEHFNAYLEPGENVRFPSLCLLFWQGEDRMVGHNNFRRFLLEHHSRHIDGKPIFYPISGGFNWGDPAPCQEYTCLDEEYAKALINRYNRFKIAPEVYWLDAGWTATSADYQNGKGWQNTNGNWIIDSTRFYNGLRPIGEHAHKFGSKFMVWFEPERVVEGTYFYNLHPEWLIRGSRTNHLFDLSNPDAVEWLSKFIGDFMEENQIDYYRQDFNIAPESLWRNHDKENRQGITEVKYIEGLYKFWDNLLERFPNAIIDNCASGGNRLDYETMLRSAPLWRTDYHYSERVGYQCHTYGLSFYIPQHGTGLYSTNPFDSRSSFSDAVVMNWKLAQQGQSYTDMQLRMAEFRDIRPYFHEDFYPLSGVGNLTGDDIWLAYELFRPSDQTGYIVAFRREQNKDKDYIVHLSGLQPDRTYVLTNRDTNESIQKSGQELADGLKLTLKDPRTSLMIKITAQ